jgi:hypothetical protein
MANRQVQSVRRYILAFIIGTSLFILGFFVVNGLTYFEYTRISNLQDNLAYQIFEDKISYELFGKDLCSDESYRKVSSDLGFQGRIIDDLERKFGVDDPRVLERKKFYSLILVEHFEFVNLRNEQCSNNINTILFFYSNKPRFLEGSEELGKLLGSVHSRNEDVVIYSFDVDLNSPLVSDLKKRYMVEQPLEILINERVKIIDVKNIDEIERHLDD